MEKETQMKKMDKAEDTFDLGMKIGKILMESRNPPSIDLKAIAGCTAAYISTLVDDIKDRDRVGKEFNAMVMEYIRLENEASEEEEK